MQGTDVPPHSGIPLGHKILAVLLAAAAGAAGWGGLIYLSGRYASTAVLAFNSMIAQSVDPGIVSSRKPAVVLAESILNDPAISILAKQAHLASTSSPDQVGEFRSELLLTQPSAWRLDVRFQGEDVSQSTAVVNAVAQVLTDWRPASGIAIAPSSSPETAGGSASLAQMAATTQSQSHPPTSVSAASQPTPSTGAVPAHPLSEELGKLSAQLSATDRELDRLQAGGTSSSSSEQSAHIESMEQALIRAQVKQVQKSLEGLRAQYSKEVANPNIGGLLSEIQKAIQAISPGGFNAAGFSTSELNSERLELRKAIVVVDQDTRKIRLAENAQPNAAKSPSGETSATQPAPASSQPSSVSAQSTAPAIQEQDIPTAALAGQTPQHSSQAAFSLIRPAGPASRPPFWPAVAAGAFCGLLYFGIAALAYRRRPSDDLIPETGSFDHRLITFADPVRFNEFAPATVVPERQNAEVHPSEAPLSPDSARESGVASVEKRQVSAEESSAAIDNPQLPPEDAAAGLTISAAAEQAASAESVAERVAGEAEDSLPPEPTPELKEAHQSSNLPPAEHRSHIWSPEPAAGDDPVADRLRKSLAGTAMARMLQDSDRPAVGELESGQHADSQDHDPPSDSVPS
jgi:hypothetical protein